MTDTQYFKLLHFNTLSIHTVSQTAERWRELRQILTIFKFILHRFEPLSVYDAPMRRLTSS